MRCDPDPNLVQVSQEVRRVVIHAVGARTLELLEAITPGEEAHSQAPGPASGEEVPNAVAYHHDVLWARVQSRGRCEEQVRVGLGPRHLVSRDRRYLFGNVEEGHRPTR